MGKKISSKSIRDFVKELDRIYHKEDNLGFSVAAANKALDESEFEPDSADENGRTMLHHVAEQGSADLFRWLIQWMVAKASINQRDAHGKTPFEVAVMADRVGMVEAMIEGDPDERYFGPLHYLLHDGDGRTLLERASEAGAKQSAALVSGYRDRMVEKALERALHTGDVQANLADPQGWTLLHRAVKVRDWARVEELLEKGADPNLHTKRGESPASIAVRDRQAEGLALLCRHGIKLRMNADGCTLMHAAAESLDGAMVRQLFGWIEETHGRREAVRTLTASDNEGKTPLHVAAEYSEKKGLPVVEAMLGLGASEGLSATTDDAYEETPAEHALSYGQPVVAAVLFAAMDPRDLPDKEKRKALGDCLEEAERQRLAAMDRERDADWVEWYENGMQRIRSLIPKEKTAQASQDAEGEPAPLMM